LGYISLPGISAGFPVWRWPLCVTRVWLAGLFRTWSSSALRSHRNGRRQCAFLGRLGQCQGAGMDHPHDRRPECHNGGDEYGPSCIIRPEVRAGGTSTAGIKRSSEFVSGDVRLVYCVSLTRSDLSEARLIRVARFGPTHRVFGRCDRSSQSPKVFGLDSPRKSLFSTVPNTFENWG
jgi:hypothetical protein